MQSPWIRLAFIQALSASAVLSGLVALRHIIMTAQRGVICGVESGHCWACYAAPLLALAALAVWRAPRPGYVRDRSLRFADPFASAEPGPGPDGLRGRAKVD